MKENNIRKYLLYRKEAWIHGLKQSEQGREFLKVLFRLQQTKADMNAVKSFRSQEGVT